MKKEIKQQNSTDTQMGYDTVLAPVFNYRCKKCGSTYTKLKKPLNYSNCVVEKPITHEKCSGQLVSF
jgi:predicted nucleic acid-binding Zn ribbon protein